MAKQTVGSWTHNFKPGCKQVHDKTDKPKPAKLRIAKSKLAKVILK